MFNPRARILTPEAYVQPPRLFVNPLGPISEMLDPYDKHLRKLANTQNRTLQDDLKIGSGTAADPQGMRLMLFRMCCARYETF